MQKICPKVFCPVKHQKGNIEVLIVTKGNKAENIDIVSHLQKTEKVGDVYAPISRTAKEAQDVIMLGDRIPIEQIWIKVNLSKTIFLIFKTIY